MSAKGVIANGEMFLIGTSPSMTVDTVLLAVALPVMTVEGRADGDVTGLVVRAKVDLEGAAGAVAGGENCLLL